MEKNVNITTKPKHDAKLPVISSKKHVWKRQDSQVSFCKNCGLMRVYEKGSGYKRYIPKDTPLMRFITMPKCK